MHLNVYYPLHLFCETFCFSFANKIFPHLFCDFEVMVSRKMNTMSALMRRGVQKTPFPGDLVIIATNRLTNEQKPPRYLEKIPLPKKYCTNNFCQCKISVVNRMTNSLRLLEGYFFGTYIKHQDTALENKFLVR